jgi:hypothetical protein
MAHWYIFPRFGILYQENLATLSSTKISMVYRDIGFWWRRQKSTSAGKATSSWKGLRFESNLICSNSISSNDISTVLSNEGKYQTENT